MEEVLDRENVDIRSMSDEELAKYGDNLDGTTDEEPAAEEEPETSEDVTETDDAGEQEGEAKETESDEEESIEQLRERLAELETKNKKLKEHTDTQSKFEQYRSNEIGALRKQLQFLQSQTGITDEQLADIAMTDPARAKQVVQAEQQRMSEMDATQAKIASAEAAMQLKEMHPDIDELMPDMAKVVEADDPNSLKAFQSDPYQFGTAILHNFATRARQTREIEKLKIELEIAKRESKRAADETLSKVDMAAKSKKAGKPASPSKPGAVKEYDRNTIASMSDSELQTLLKELDNE